MYKRQGVDLAVVGKFSETASVSAVSTGSQVMQTATVIVTGLTMGVTVLLGQSIGAGDKERAGGIVAGQIKLFIFVAVFLTVVMIAFAEKAALIMNVPSAAIDEAVSYIRTVSYTHLDVYKRQESYQVFFVIQNLFHFSKMFNSVFFCYFPYDPAGISRRNKMCIRDRTICSTLRQKCLILSVQQKI